MMGEPALSFSIPSLHDDTILDCRIYHPKDFRRVLVASEHVGRRLKGSIIAHPYAPLGGSFDDAVVLSVVETLQQAGFVAGTFNFRYLSHIRLEDS